MYYRGYKSGYSSGYNSSYSGTGTTTSVASDIPLFPMAVLYFPTNIMSW